MPMFFLDKRAQVICDELKKEAVLQRRLIENWEMKIGDFIRPEDAEAAEAPFEPFDCKTMHWYGPDKHYWFRTEITVPESFDGTSAVKPSSGASKPALSSRARRSASL